MCLYELESEDEEADHYRNNNAENEVDVYNLLRYEDAIISNDESSYICSLYDDACISRLCDEATDDKALYLDHLALHDYADYMSKLDDYYACCVLEYMEDLEIDLLLV